MESYYLVLLVPAGLGLVFLALLPWVIFRPRHADQHADDWTDEGGFLG